VQFKVVEGDDNRAKLVRLMQYSLRARWGLEVRFHLLLTQLIYGAKFSASLFFPFTPRSNPSGTRQEESYMDSVRGKRKICVRTENQTRTVLLVS
jgi:hypothetical protein